MMFPRTFVDRRCKSFDMPRVRPVNSITSATPSATPTTLMPERSGRCRMFESTRLSKTFIPKLRTQKFNTSATRTPSESFAMPPTKQTIFFAGSRLLWCVQIDFGQVSLIFQHEYFGLVLLIKYHRLRRLISEADFVVILRARQTDFRRQREVLLADGFEI